MHPVSNGQLLQGPAAFAPPLPGTAAGDSGSAVVLLRAVRSLMRVTTREEVVGALMDVVRDVGGAITSSAQQVPAAINIDLSFGMGGPLLAYGEAPDVDATLREILPELIEDAQLAIERIEQSPVTDAGGTTDPLTGLGNWNFTLRALERMSPGDSVAIIDLENLKHVNDYYSPATGDQLLLSFARTLRRVARASDSVGRVGGTEFTWLFRNCNATEAESALRRLRSTWEAERAYEEVTFSAGVALVTASGPSEAYMYADVALETAKRSGTNVTFVSQ
jgi:diguanylate cyclase (GGDEF)-like protein